MKTHFLILSVASLTVLLTGCVNPDGTQNNTGSGALIGGAFGALTGAAIGGSHHGGQDALIGAAVGALADAAAADEDGDRPSGGGPPAGEEEAVLAAPSGARPAPTSVLCSASTPRR